MSSDDTALLFGLPITYTTFTVYPFTINDVIEFGLQDYNLILGILSMEKEEIGDKFSIYDIDLYELVIVIFYNDDRFKDIFLRFFTKLLGSQICFNADNYFMLEDFTKIEDVDFYEIVNILLKQNMLSNKNYQIKNKKEKEYQEMVRKAKEKYKKVLQDNNDTILLDIISSVSAKHPSFNLLNISDLTLYQLYNQFYRLTYIDDYFINIKAMLAGADNKNLEHWSRKIINK